jgi:hypothetical protein
MTGLFSHLLRAPGSVIHRSHSRTGSPGFSASTVTPGKLTLCHIR